MNKKVMLIPILALLLLSVPMAMAGTVYIEGDGTYSQTTEFSDVSDSVTLSGQWIFESNWGYVLGRPDIDNYVRLFDDAIFSEHAVSPRGVHYGEGYTLDYSYVESENPGLNLETFVQYGETSIYDTAEIQVRGYDFTFTANYIGSYASTKDLRIYDSYYNTFEDGTDIEEMDWVMFKVVDITESANVFGGMIEYEERCYTQSLGLNKLYLRQTFSQDSDTSNIEIYHSTSDWVRSTAFFGEGTIVDDAIVFDWYGTVTEETIPYRSSADRFWALFDDDVADFSMQHGKPGISYILDAYNTGDDFYASGHVLDLDWDFIGTIINRLDDSLDNDSDPWSDWEAHLDMET